MVVCVLAGQAARAQSYAAFDFKAQTDLVVPVFRDAEVTDFLATLDHLLARESDPARWRENATDVLWQFARRLQTGQLSAAQETRVLTHLDGIASSIAGGAAVVRAPRLMISDLTVGKKAPPISGTDLDGRPFTLADYRDKVVVLVFSADWCGICRAQAPYERFLMDRYAHGPFALLGVQTGSSREAARQAQETDRLSYRSWWDAPQPGDRSGPIASAWNVLGWPATYVIDGEGIIRFVDLREEDLLRAVRQLVESQADRDAKPRLAK